MSSIVGTSEGAIEGHPSADGLDGSDVQASSARTPLGPRPQRVAAPQPRPGEKRGRGQCVHENEGEGRDTKTKEACVAKRPAKRPRLAEEEENSARRRSDGPPPPDLADGDEGGDAGPDAGVSSSEEGVQLDGAAVVHAGPPGQRGESIGEEASPKRTREDGQPNLSLSTIGPGTAVNAASAAGTDVASTEEGRNGGLGGEADDGAPLPRNAVVDGDEDDELEDQCNVETIESLLAAHQLETAAELFVSLPSKSEERGDEAPFVTECLDDLFIRNQYQRQAVNRLVDVAATSQEDDVAEYLGQKLTSYLQLYLKVKANPGRYDPAVLSDAFNNDRLETGERIERAEQKGQSEHLSSQINQGNPTSPSTLVLGLLHFGPTGSKSNGRYDCNAHDQCCIKALRQSLNRCTFHACFGERTEETFEEEMPTVDLLPINADKGSQDELDAQVEACASRLGLASKYEVYAINLLNYIGHAIVHLAQHQSALTVVVASSVTSERWFSEVGRGKYLLGILKSPGANVVFTLHPQAWIMGVNQSLRRYPEDIRRGINSVMKFVLGKLIRQKLLEPEAKQTFDNYVCDVMGSFGRKGKWIESNIERGMLSYLAKVAANHNLLAMSAEDLAKALTSGRFDQVLGEATVALFLDQIDLHGPPTFMKLLHKFGAGHDLHGMARRLNANFSVTEDLKPDIKRAMAVLKKDEAYIVKRLRNLRRRDDYNSSLATLASKLFNGEYKTDEFVGVVANFAKSHGKKNDEVMQHVLNTVYMYLKRFRQQLFSFERDDQEKIDGIGANPLSIDVLSPLIKRRLVLLAPEERQRREAAAEAAAYTDRVVSATVAVILKEGTVHDVWALADHELAYIIRKNRRSCACPNKFLHDKTIHRMIRERVSSERCTK